MPLCLHSTCPQACVSNILKAHLWNTFFTGIEEAFCKNRLTVVLCWSMSCPSRFLLPTPNEAVFLTTTRDPVVVIPAEDEGLVAWHDMACKAFSHTILVGHLWALLMVAYIGRLYRCSIILHSHDQSMELIEIFFPCGTADWYPRCRVRVGILDIPGFVQGTSTDVSFFFSFSLMKRQVFVFLMV